MNNILGDNNIESNKDKTQEDIVKDNTKAIYGVFHTLMSLLAIYLSYRCNNNHFNPTSFIIALCCPYVYIIYILATKGTCSK
jgi:hypothetical protein